MANKGCNGCARWRSVIPCRKQHADCKRHAALLSTSAMLHRLNDQTRPHHVEADTPWLSLMRVDVRRQDYVRQLAVTYGFEAPLEGAFAYTRGLSALVALRVRAGLIAQDLLALGMMPAQLSELPQCFSITPFTDAAEAMGWMYVVERASLVHDSVRRSLLHRVPEARHASAYLSAAGSVAGPRWQSFGMALDKFVTDDKKARQVASAAEHAYRRWRDWVELNQPEQRSTG